MIRENATLARQMGMMMTAIQEELRYLASGIVFVQIRNDEIGKFGIKHDPIEMEGEGLPQSRVVMQDQHLKAFREMVIGALSHKKNWTHGEIYFEFAMRRNMLCASVQLESNYNMANLMNRRETTY